MQDSNFYDRIEVNVNSLFDSNIDPKKTKHPSYFQRVFKRYLTAVLIKIGLYYPLIEAGFIIGWFEDFKSYWYNVLKGRPLYLHDFYYLLGVYRQRFQKLVVPDQADENTFLEAWQNPIVMYQLFGYVRRCSREPLHSRRFEKWIKSGYNILEYGCGIAPISHSLLQVSLKRDLNITIADIRQINFHYAIYRLAGNVNHFEITPFKNSIPRKTYDVIFMNTVFEHLPDPLDTLKNITAGLKSKGIFIFDYILGDGDGLDTMEGVIQREEVLLYINDHYDLLSGELLKEKSMGMTVCRLK